MSKSLELERRVARLELNLTAVRTAIEELARRNAALQAELDHLTARVQRS